MYCPKCGNKNDDGAAFCVNCGGPLSVVPSSIRPPAQPPTAPISQSGVLGAVLNFLFPGLGYWYLGYRKVLGIHPALFLIGIWIVEFIVAFLIPTLSFVPLLISLFVAYDAYVKATGKPGWINAERN